MNYQHVIEEARAKEIRQLLPLGSRGWLHPWSISGRYDPKLKEWVASVKPGFVNGLDATLQTVWSRATPQLRARYQREGLPVPSSDDEVVEAYLTEMPVMTLRNWRSIGPDATPLSVGVGLDGQVRGTYESVPDFFKSLGVGKPPALEEGVNGIETSEAETGVRLMRVSDVMLYRDRTASDSQMTVDDGSDGTIVSFAVTQREAANKRLNAYVRTMAKYTPPVPADPLQRLLGNWSDTTRDELRLATLFLVSPIDAPLGSEPDGSWMPYVQHRVCWNLNHALNRLELPVQDDPLRLQTGLLGGIGDMLINFLLAQINDITSAISQWFGREEIKGRFWTT